MKSLSRFLYLFLFCLLLGILSTPKKLEAQHFPSDDPDLPKYCVCIVIEHTGFCAKVYYYNPSVVGLCGGPAQNEQSGYCLPV